MPLSRIGLLVAVTIGIVGTSSASDWVFDGSAITDGEWTFAAAADGTDLTVNSVLSDPGNAASLDFSKPIEGGYVIVKLNPKFNAYANKGNLVELLLPSTGLAEISQDAFNGCTALTKVSPYLPDSVW